MHVQHLRIGSLDVTEVTAPVLETVHLMRQDVAELRTEIQEMRRRDTHDAREAREALEARDAREPHIIQEADDDYFVTITK